MIELEGQPVTRNIMPSPWEGLQHQIHCSKTKMASAHIFRVTDIGAYFSCPVSMQVRNFYD